LRNIAGMKNTLNGRIQQNPDKARKNSELNRAIHTDPEKPPVYPEWDNRLGKLTKWTSQDKTEEKFINTALSPFGEAKPLMIRTVLEILDLNSKDARMLQKKKYAHSHIQKSLYEEIRASRKYVVWRNNSNFFTIETEGLTAEWILQEMNKFFKYWCTELRQSIKLDTLKATQWYGKFVDESDSNAYEKLVYQAMAAKIGEFSELCEMQTTDPSQPVLQQTGTRRCVNILNETASRYDSMTPEEKTADTELRESVMELTIDPSTLSSRLSKPEAGSGWGKQKSAKSEAGGGWGGRDTKSEAGSHWGKARGPQPSRDEEDAVKNPYKFLGPGTENFESLAGPETKKQAPHLSRLQSKILDAIQVAEGLHNYRLAEMSNVNPSIQSLLWVSRSKWELFRLDLQFAAHTRLSHDIIPREHWDPISVRSTLQEAQAKITAGGKHSRHREKQFGSLLTANGTDEKTGSVIIRMLAKIALDKSVKAPAEDDVPISSGEIQRAIEASLRIPHEDEKHGKQIMSRAVRFGVMSEILGGLVAPRILFRNGHYSVALAVPGHQLAQLVPLYEIAKNDLDFMCGNDKKLGETIFGNPFDQVDAELKRLGVEDTGSNRIVRNLGLPGKGLKNFFEFYTAPPGDMAAALLQAYQSVRRTEDLSSVSPEQIDHITRTEAILNSKRNTKLLDLLEIEDTLTSHNELLEQLRAQSEAKQAELDKYNSEVKEVLEQKTTLEQQLIQGQIDLSNKKAILAQIEGQIGEATEKAKKRVKQLDETEEKYQSKRAKMAELQTGDTMALANVMYLYVLGDEPFDLNRIVSALNKSGEPEDLSMVRVIEKIQKTPAAVAQAQKANSAHSSVRAVDKSQEQSPEGADSEEAEKAATEGEATSTALTEGVENLMTEEEVGKAKEEEIDKTTISNA